MKLLGRRAATEAPLCSDYVVDHRSPTKPGLAARHLPFGKRLVLRYLAYLIGLSGHLHPLRIAPTEASTTPKDKRTRPAVSSEKAQVPRGASGLTTTIAAVKRKPMSPMRTPTLSSQRPILLRFTPITIHVGQLKGFGRFRGGGRPQNLGS